MGRCVDFHDALSLFIAVITYADIVGKDWKESSGAYKGLQDFIELPKRERKTLLYYDENAYYREKMGRNRKTDTGPKVFKYTPRPDYQFFNNAR